MRSESLVSDSDVAKSVPVSVVIPAYNASRYLAATLASIASQSFQPREVIVVDDGSTDNTAEIARTFGVRLISVANGGPSAARNAGTRVALSEYVAFMDADDLWAPDKLATQVAALRSYSQPAFSFTDFRTFDEFGIHESSSGLRHHPAFRRIARRALALNDGQEMLIVAKDKNPVLYDSYIQPSSVIVRRADFLSIGGFDETLRVYEDHEFLLRLFKVVPAIGVMRSLLLYRRHDYQATADQTSMKRGLFELARRVERSPERYPLGDAQYLAKTEFQRYYRLGIEQARAARFDEAAVSFKSSLAERWTASANLLFVGARVCRSSLGRTAFSFARTLWKSRALKR